MFQENSIQTCILSRVKQITGPGCMHETSARTWCSGRTWRERVGREVGGGIGMGKTCEPKAFSFQCMTKFTTNKKMKNKKISFLFFWVLFIVVHFYYYFLNLLINVVFHIVKCFMSKFNSMLTVIMGFPCGSAGKESACNVRDLG